MDRRKKWQILLANGLADELAVRREKLQPKLENRLRRLEGCTIAATYKMLQRIRKSLQLCIEVSAQPEGRP